MADRDENEQHFATDHLLAGMSGHLVRGGTLTLIGAGGTAVVQVAGLVVLARLVTPGEYGVVAMAMVVTGFVMLFNDLGLAAATIHQPHITHNQVSTVFWINAGISVLLFAFCAACSPIAAWVFGEPRLTTVIVCMSTAFILQGLGAQHAALLRRQMRLGTSSAIGLAGVVSGTGVAIAAAAAGAGYWALLARFVVTPAVNTALFWTACRWRPGLPVRGSGVRKMLKFGGYLTGFGLVNFFARNADDALIGWYWGAGPLGLYSRAYRLLTLPLSLVSGPLATAVVPALSRLHDDPDRFSRLFLDSLRVLCWLTLPLSAFMIVAAEPLVQVALGEAWMDAVPIFRMLAISMVAQPIANCTGWLFISTGQTKRMFVWGCISSPIIVAGASLALPFGPEAVAVCYSIIVWILIPPLIWFSTRNTPVRPVAIGAMCLPPLLVAVAAGALADITANLLPGSGTCQQLAVKGAVTLLVSALAFLANRDRIRMLTAMRAGLTRS